MAEREQAKPFAQAAFHFRSDEEEATSVQLKLRQRKYIKCCGCLTAIFLILVVTILVLSFTVFHFKNPQVWINKITVQQLEFASNGSLRQDVNVTLLTDVSVKNPNFAPFKFNNGTTTIYYRGAMVGEGQTPSGNAKARRTFHMNVTVDLIPEKLSEVNLSSGMLNMSSYTVIGGQIRILARRHVVVSVNCTVAYDITSQKIKEENCRPHLSI